MVTISITIAVTTIITMSSTPAIHMVTDHLILQLPVTVTLPVHCPLQLCLLLATGVLGIIHGKFGWKDEVLGN